MLCIRTTIKAKFLALLAASLFTLLLAACDMGPTPLPTPTNTEPPNPSATIPANADATPTSPLSQATTEPTSAASPTTVAAQASRIIYLDPDGITVKSVLHDGTAPRTVAVIEKKPDQRVTTLSADPTGQYLVYTLSSSDPDVFSLKTYLWHDDQSSEITPLFERPRWSPEGVRFAAQALDTTGGIYLHDLRRGTGEILPVQGSPDWFPHGQWLVYTDGSNIFSYVLATKVSTPLTALPDDETNQWQSQEVHVLPNGDRIIFSGGLAVKDGQSVLDPHGEERVWWWIPSTGGTPQHWGEIVGKGGASNYSASPRRNRIAVSHSHFAGATCPTYEDVGVVGFDVVYRISSTLPITATSAPNTGIDPDGEWVTQVNGLAWSPDGTEFAYGVERHACVSGEPTGDPLSSTIYVWDGDPDKDPRLTIEGSYPSWVQRE